MMSVASARRRLPGLGARIERTKALLDALYADRLEAFQVLTDEGDTQQSIADRANERVVDESSRITPMAVAFQLHKARKQHAVAARNGNT